MQRDKNLKNSMFLPQTTNSLNRRPSGYGQYNISLQNSRKPPQPYSSTQSNYQVQNVTILQNRQVVHTSSYQQSNLSTNRPNDTPSHQILQRLDKLTRLVDKHQLHLNTLSPQPQLTKRILTQLKKNIPPLNTNNDVYDLILAQKLQIKQLQDQLSKIPKYPQLQQMIKKQLSTLTKNNNQPNSLTNTNGTSSITTSTISTSSTNKQLDPILSDMLKKRDQFFQNILANIQTQISIIKKNINNLNIQMKISPISSSSCIMLKYQQLFKARNKSENDIVLSQCTSIYQLDTYFIDNQGQLLDCHSRYIVDQKGKKIKLQEKHLTMLRKEKLLP